MEEQTHIIASARAGKKTLALKLTIVTWLVTVLLAFLFYVAVQKNLPGTDWLAGLLLGMIIFSWVVTIRWLNLLSPPVQSAFEGAEMKNRRTIVKIRRETPISFEGKEITMNTQIKTKFLTRMIAFLFILIAAMALSACASRARAAESFCFVEMGVRVTIAVTDVKPRAFFDQLADQTGCPIPVSPFVWKHVTLHVTQATLSQVLSMVCPQIGCKYIYNGGQLSIHRFTIFDRLQESQWERFNKYMEERNGILQSSLPKGMSFTDVPLSTVLKEISKVSGLTIKPWKDEGDRRVTLDVSGMTVDEAIKAVLLYVDGEGAVLIEQRYFLHHSWGQHWPWGYPPTP